MIRRALNQHTNPQKRRVVPLPPGLFHEVQGLLVAADQLDIPQDEALERFNDLIGAYLPYDYDPETEEIILQERRGAQAQVPHNYGAS